VACSTESVIILRNIAEVKSLNLLDSTLQRLGLAIIEILYDIALSLDIWISVISNMTPGYFLIILIAIASLFERSRK